MDEKLEILEDQLEMCKDINREIFNLFLEAIAKVIEIQAITVDDAVKILRQSKIAR